MEPLDSDSSKEAQKLSEHKMKLSKKTVKEKPKKDGEFCCSKYMKHFISMDDNLEEIVHLGMEALDNQKSMTKTLGNLVDGIKTMNKEIITYFKSTQKDRNYASDLTDNLFDDTPFTRDTPADTDFAPMTENSASRLIDEFEDLSDLNASLQETGDSIVRVVDDLGDDFDDFIDELKTVNEGDNRVSQAEENRLQAIEEHWSDTLLQEVVQIQKNTREVADYYKDIGKKKTGTTGKSTHDNKDKDDDSGWGLSDLLAGWFGIKALGKMLGKGLNKYFGGMVKKIVDWVKYPFKWLSLKMKKIWKKFADKAQMQLIKWASALHRTVVDPVEKFFTKWLVSPVQKMWDSASKAVKGFWKKMKKNPIVKFVTNAWKTVTKFFHKLIPKSLIKTVTKMATKMGSGIVMGLLKTAGKIITQTFGFAIFALWDFYDGFTAKGTEEVTGIKKESQTMWDNLHSGISSLLSGMTLGIIDAKTIYEFTNKVGEGIWTHITEPILNIFPKIAESISKVLDDALSLLPKSWKEAGSSMWNMIAGEDEKEAPAYQKSQAYLNKRKMQYAGQLTSEEAVKNPLHALPSDRPAMVSTGVVSPQPMALNTKTASTTDKFAYQSRQKQAPAQAPANVTVNNTKSGNKSSGVNRALNTGRSDINRSIGRGSQFNFGG